MGQPDGEGTDVPEIEIRSGIQDSELQADRRGWQDAVDPDGNLLGQRHVNDDWQDAEQERGGHARRNVFKTGREKQGKACCGKQGEQSGSGDKDLKLPDIHVRQIDNGE